MRSQQLTNTALSMIERHGLQAQAVALERASEMQVKGDTAEFARWRQIHDLIWELKRTRRESHTEQRQRAAY
jgi:hypothetical protein